MLRCWSQSFAITPHLGAAQFLEESMCRPAWDSPSLEDYFGIQVPEFLRGVKLKPSYFVTEKGSNAGYFMRNVPVYLSEESSMKPVGGHLCIGSIILCHVWVNYSYIL